MKDSIDSENGPFSLVAGGPFTRILLRLGLTRADQLPSTKAAITLALLAWLSPAILALAQSIFDDQYNGWSYFQDLTVYTRFLVAILVMLATERYADERIGLLVQQFSSAKLLQAKAKAQFKALLVKADRMTASAIAEGIILSVAVVWSVFITYYTIQLAGTSWEGESVAGKAHLSWAGYAAAFLSTPIFLFLVLRWIWRFLVWTLLLFRIARLPLQLTPAHPDRAGGLGFLSIYPSVFTGFVFALSCVVTASFLKDLSLAQHSATTVWLALAVWMAMILIMFLGPLLVFISPLYHVKEQAVLSYSRLASEHHLAFQAQWIEKEKNGAELLGSPIPSTLADLNASVQTVLDMRTVPINAGSVVQLFLSAGLPLFAIVLQQIPLAELMKWIIGTIL